MLRLRVMPWVVAPVGLALGLASVWAVQLALEVADIRADLSQRVVWLGDIQEVQASLGPEAGPSPNLRDSVATLQRDHAALAAALAHDPKGVRALDRLQAALSVEPVHPSAVDAGHDIVRALRLQSRDASRALGKRWDGLKRLVWGFVALSFACTGLLAWVSVTRERQVRLAEALRDHSDRRAAQAEAQHGVLVGRTRRDLQAVLEAVPVGVAVLAEGLVVYANRELARACEVERPAALIGRTLEVPDRLDVSPAVALTWHEAPAEIVVVRDLSEWKALQAQLRLGDRLRSVGTLAAGVAHEINNPLTYVLLDLVALQHLVADVPETQELVDEIREGAERVAQVVKDLSLFTRIDLHDEPVVDPVPVAEASARLAGYPARHHVSVEVEAASVPSVGVGEARLGQLFLALVMNGVQAALEEEGPQVVRVHLSDPIDDTVVIEVHDDGPGISESDLQQVFDPFFTTRAVGEGMGLGLFVAHQIVTAAGGEITIRSSLGEGTTVRAVLPAAFTELSEDSEPVTAVRLKLLLVDDEPLVAQALARSLSNHDVTVVASVAEAREVLASHAIDGILCDVNLAGEPGRHLLDHVREVRPDRVRAFAFGTAGVLTAADRAQLAAGDVLVLTKPYEPTSLRRWLRRARTR